MIFRDRQDAGTQLAVALTEYRRQEDVIILALPRGGVVVGTEVARELQLPLDIVVPRKIGAPGNEEFAIGAITETGEGVFNDAVIAQYGIAQSYIDEMIEREKKEAQRRLKTYRGNRPALDLSQKTVILVDDGIATGLTMRAAIASVRAKGAKRIILAAPVAAADSLEMLRPLVDGVACLHAPEFFGAVGAFYEHFDQTTDDEVIKILRSRTS